MCVFAYICKREFNQKYLFLKTSLKLFNLLYKDCIIIYNIIISNTFIYIYNIFTRKCKASVKNLYRHFTSFCKGDSYE